MFERLNPFNTRHAAASPMLLAALAEGEAELDRRRQALAAALVTATTAADRQCEQASKALASAQAAEARAQVALDKARAERVQAESALTSASMLRERNIDTTRRELRAIAPPELLQFEEDLERQSEMVRNGVDGGPFDLKALPGVFDRARGESEHPLLAALVDARRAADELLLRGGLEAVRAGIAMHRKRIALAEQEHVAALAAARQRADEDAPGGRSRPATAFEASVRRAIEA